MESPHESDKRRLKEALLVDYSIKDTINLMEEEPSMKLMLKLVMNEMSRHERDGCKLKLQWSILALVQGSTRLQEMMAGIRGKCCNLEVYERIWNELVAEVNKSDDPMEVFETTDSPDEPEVFEAIEPCEAFSAGLAWWRQDEDEDLVHTTDEEENFWVNQDGDWGDETILMRRSRYRRMKARHDKGTMGKREHEKCRPY